MQRKPSEFFHTYRPWQGEGGTWYVLSNLTSYPTRVSQHPDEKSARDHARILNDIWKQAPDEIRLASLLSLPQLPNTYRISNPVDQSKSFLAGIALYFRSLFRILRSK